MTSQPHGTPQPQAQYQAQPQASAQPQMSNPFSGLPVVDVLRDVAALVFLFAALFYSWNIDRGEKMGAELWYVDVATVLAVLALVPSYLTRLGVFGPRWNVATNGLIRLLATIPYFISVLVVVILDIADDRAVGVGVAVGLFGALLVAQPRKHELPPSHLAPSDRIWLYITGGLLALAAVLVLVTSLVFISDLNDLGADAPEIIVYVLGALVVTAALVYPAVLALLAKPHGVALVAGVGIVALILGMLHIDGQNISQLFGFILLPAGFESFEIPGFGAFLVIGAAAAALSPGASRSTGGATHPVSLVGAAQGAFLLITLSAVAHVLGAIFVGLVSDDFAAPSIITLIVYVLVAVVGVLGLLTTRAGGNKVLPLGAAAGFFLLVTICAIVIAIMDDGSAGFIAILTSGRDVAADTWLGALLVALAIAFAVVGADTLGRGVKKVFANTQGGAPGAAGGGAPLPGAPQAPAYQAPQAPQAAPSYGAPESTPEQTAVIPTVSSTPSPEPAAPATDPVVQRASDPTIDQAELAQIAQLHPHARAAVAQNPQAYPGLLDWLGQLGDPEVDAALARRQG